MAKSMDKKHPEVPLAMQLKNLQTTLNHDKEAPEDEEGKMIFAVSN